MSEPNQKVITIHQTKEVPFVMVGIQELREAYAKMPPATFMLYLYLAGNADGYKFELSAAAFKNAMGYSRSSYHRAVGDLTKLGYIYEDNGHLNFATSPKIGKRGLVQNWEKDESEKKQSVFKDETEKSQICNEVVPEMNIEINNKYKTNNTNKIDSPSASKDYSYLDEIVCYEDGSYTWDNKTFFIDGNSDMHFYEKPKEYQAKVMAEITPFKMGEIQYILSKMEELNNE